MLSFNDIRKGKIIVFEGEPYTVMSAEFLRKQQRRPVRRTTLRHLKTGATKEHSFQQSDRLEEADIDRLKVQFLYQEQGRFIFMQEDTYEQHEVPAHVVADIASFLIEGQEAQLVLFDGAPVVVELPIKVRRQVVEAPPGIKGDTSTNVMKDVTIEGGGKIKAPLFIAADDTIVVDTRDGSYVERG